MYNDLLGDGKRIQLLKIKDEVCSFTRTNMTTYFKTVAIDQLYQFWKQRP